MRNLRCVALVFVAIALTGCGYQRLRVMVYDWDTEKPVENAVVEVHYPSVLDPFAPRPVKAVTDAAGVADFKFADRTFFLSARKDGYNTDCQRDRTSFFVDNEGQKVDRRSAKAGDMHVFVCWLRHPVDGAASQR